MATLLMVGILGPLAFAAVVLGYDAKVANTNVQLRQALNDKEEQRRETNKNLRLALLAIDDYATKISEDDQLKDVRKTLLQLPVKLFEELLQRPPPDPDLQQAYANAYLRLGNLAREMGSHQKAMQAYGEAMKLAEALGRDHPGDTKYQLLLSDVLTGQAIVYQDVRRLDDAETAFQKALAIARQLAKEHPADAACQAALAQLHNNLAVLYEETDRFPQAEAALSSAQEVFAKLVQGHPRFEKFQHSLAATHYNLGRVYTRTNRLKPAVEAFGEACEVWRKLSHGHPDKPVYQDVLARSLIALGIVYDRIGRPDEALKPHDEAGEIYRKLAAEHPKVPGYQAGLARFHYQLGQAFADIGRMEQAEKAYGKAIEEFKDLIKKYPEIEDYRFGLSVVQWSLGFLFCNIGQLERANVLLNDARKILEKLSNDRPSASNYRAGLGNTFSNLGLMAFLQDDPMAARDWLNRAVETLESVLKQEYEHPDARHFLKIAYDRRMQVLIRLGHHKDTLRNLERSLQLAGGAKNDEWRLRHAYALAQTSQHPPAMTEVDELDRRQSLSPLAMYNLARICSLCSSAVRRDAQLTKVEQDRRAEQYAARAVAFLKKAKAAGYFKPAAAMEEMRKDKDLDVLRPRRDFQELFLSLDGSVRYYPGTEVPQVGRPGKAVRMA